MKKLLVIFVCIFFLFSLIAFAQNETNITAPPGNVTAPANITLPSLGNATNAGNTGNATLPSSGNATQTARPAAPPARPPAVPRNTSQKATPCGNGKVDAGENCLSCAKDVKCQSGQICNLETGTCDSQANYTAYIILGIGIFVLLGLFFFAKRLMKKKEEPLPKQQPAAVQAQKPVVQQPPFGQQQPPLGQQPLTTNQQPMTNSQPSPVANAPIQLPPSTPAAEPSAEEKKEKEQGFQEMSQVVNEHPGETMPQKFIRQMREKGWNDERIRMKMKESGWNETQIALEFLKAPKFVKKS